MELDPEGTDRDLHDITRSYLRDGGAFRVLVDSRGAIVGCGGLFPHGPDELEIRKMYLLPPFRGRGYGRALLADLVELARIRGARRIVLETKSVLREAIALYQRFGFVEVKREILTPRCDRAFALEL
jgi:putative acetyltransferase